MGVRSNSLTTSTRECHTDLLIAQFLYGSPAFREWFLGRPDGEPDIESLIGVACNVYDSGRETDIEVGYRASDGQEHLILIENKIAAAEQENQLEDYHERGRKRVQRGDWDSFSVYLVAPEQWIDQRSREKVDEAVSYEAISETLETLDHDASDFAATVFEEGMDHASSSVEDLSGVVANIRRSTEARLADLTDFRVWSGRKALELESAHPDHPDWIVYKVYITRGDAFGNTNVRLLIQADDRSIRSQVTDTVFEEEFREDGSPVEGYDIRPDKKNAAVTNIYHEEAGQFPEDVVESVAAEVERLVRLAHPKIVDADLPEIDDEEN